MMKIVGAIIYTKHFDDAQKRSNDEMAEMT